MKLKNIEYNVAVFITNQMTADPGGRFIADNRKCTRFALPIMLSLTYL